MTNKAQISWSVSVPNKDKTALGHRRPRAKLSIGEDETIEIPKVVGKRLERLEREKTSFGSRAELLYRVKEISHECAHERMEALINYRDYSSEELTRKLLDDGYSSSVVRDIVERAQEVGIINDQRFAESFIRSKLASGWGSLRIVRELEHRGIASDEHDEFEELLPSTEEEYERAFELARKRRLTGTNDYQKLVRFLVSRGYAPYTASSVAKERLDEAQMS